MYPTKDLVPIDYLLLLNLTINFKNRFKKNYLCQSHVQV